MQLHATSWQANENSIPFDPHRVAFQGTWRTGFCGIGKNNTRHMPRLFQVRDDLIPTPVTIAVTANEKAG
jgi:hypothetical protein